MSLQGKRLSRLYAGAEEGKCAVCHKPTTKRVCDKPKCLRTFWAAYKADQRAASGAKTLRRDVVEVKDAKSARRKVVVLSCGHSLEVPASYVARRPGGRMECRRCKAKAA